MPQLIHKINYTKLLVKLLIILFSQYFVEEEFFFYQKGNRVWKCLYKTTVQKEKKKQTERKTSQENFKEYKISKILINQSIAAKMPPLIRQID